MHLRPIVDDIGHNCIGHNFMGHTYIGHSYVSMYLRPVIDLYDRQVIIQAEPIHALNDGYGTHRKGRSAGHNYLRPSLLNGHGHLRP